MTTNPNSKAINAVTHFRTPEEENRMASELTTYLSEGDSYFVISKRWYTSWQKYIEPSLGGAPRPRPRPGPIDNNDIIIDDDTTSDDDPQLRRFLVEDEDYVLVPPQFWKTLLEWYNGGPTIPMTLISLFLSHARDDDDSVTEIRLSKQASIRELYHKVCAKTGVPQEKARIWDYFNMWKVKLLDPLSNESLEESGLLMDQDILLEVDEYSAVNEQGLVPLEPSGSGHSLSITSLEKGLAGLVNLGNTCYMNSALQCLAHTPPILQYFLRDYTDNPPLGISGELAKAFGELLQKLWSSGSNPVVPRLFKTKLDKAAPQFSGHDQHDSHELLISLLARLHEVSGIVNVCQGQCKSTLVCPVCGETSTTYDSFMCLSLPLPSKLKRSISLLSCLEEYLAEEPLGPDNRFCPECKEKRQANKKLDLWKLPEILVLQLKRFRSSNKHLVKKIEKFVNFPINDLDLSEYVKNKNDQSYLYELYAVSNHYSGIGGVCHYTAYAKLIDYNKWYHFNDTLVSPVVNESDIKSSAAYLLFYRRRVGSETTKAQSSDEQI